MVLNMVYSLQDWAKKTNNRFLKDLIVQKHDSKGDFLLRTKYGTIIEAWSADEPEKLVGAGLTKVIIDEAALVKEKAWIQSLRPTLADHKGNALFISTPKGENWFHEIYLKGQDEQETEWESWRYTSYDNNYLDKKEIDSMAKDMPKPEYSQEVMAEFLFGMGRMFEGVRACIGGQLEEPEEDEIYYMGVDLARKVAFTVITVIKGSTRQVVYWFRGHHLPWRLQKEKIKNIYEKYNHAIGRVDATGVGDAFCGELTDVGIGLEPYVFTGGWGKSKKALIDKLAILIERKKLRFPNINQIVRELEHYKVEKTDSGGIKYGTFGKFTDDCVDSLALACWELPPDEDSGSIELINQPTTDY